MMSIETARSTKLLKPYELLENILINIEKNLRNGIDTDNLSQKYDLSEGHLRRLFAFAFNQSIACYIRSRRLAASLVDLLETDSKILAIALNYGFGCEHSYIKAFKHEFGLTPGNLRKSGQIVKIKPPIHLLDENKQSDSLFFGPDIVMVPEFHVIGKRRRIPECYPITFKPEAAKDFWYNERKHIKTETNSDVYIGLTRTINMEENYSEYMPSVQVKHLENIPHGYHGYTFVTSQCARFRYIGKHHYHDIDRNAATAMYDIIQKFANNKESKYMLSDDKVFFEKIDTTLYDGTYCQMEWITPVTEK
jgi:AraC family transcriptional regulator